MELDIQYLLAFHWSLSMLQGGTEDILPQSLGERIYAVFLFIIAFMVAALMLSVLTSSLTQSHIIKGDMSQRVATLRKFLKQNEISSNLALRVQRSAQHAISGDLSAEAVELLQVVSDPLRAEMHYEMYTAVLRSHNFFNCFIDASYQGAKKVCHAAVSMLLLTCEDEIFVLDEVPDPPRMYFIVRGKCIYENEEEERIKLHEKQWIAEPSLWTSWVHRGTFVAIEDAKIAAVNGKDFQDVMTTFSVSGCDSRAYAAEFVEHMNQCSSVDDLTKVTFAHGKTWGRQCSKTSGG